MDSDSGIPREISPLQEGEKMNSGELKMEPTTTTDKVLGVSQESQTLENSDNGPQDVRIPKSEIEVPLGKSVEPGNGHLEIGHVGELESTGEMEQLQDSKVEPMDLPMNNVEDPAYLQQKLEEKVESDSKTDVEGHQGDMIEAQEKSDLDVSENLQQNEDVAKHPVDSDEGRKSELVSDKISPTDPNDGDITLGQPTVADSADIINGSEFVNDRNGSESVAVENGSPLIESKSVINGDVPLSSEAEKVNASKSDVLPDSGTMESVAEVSSDVQTKTPTPTAYSLDSHTSGIDGVVENGNSKSESVAIQDLDSVENSKVQSEVGAVNVSVSDESMNTHPESHGDIEPASDQDGKQHIASEVTGNLVAPASEENSDAVIVADESVSEAASDGLSCTKQQESEHNEIVELVEKLPSHVPHEDAPSGNDKSVNLSDDRSEGFSEDRGVDTNQKIQEDCNSPSEEITYVNEKHAPVEKVQENNGDVNLNSGVDVCQNSAKEVKDSPTGENVSHESAETISTNINGSLSLLDSKSADSELADGAADETDTVAKKSEAAQLVKECTEPHVGSPTTDDGQIEREVNSGSGLNATKTTSVDVCEDITSEEVSEKGESDIKETSVINADEEVDSDTKSFDSKSPLANNEIVKVGEEEVSTEEKNETSGATTSVESEAKSCAQDLESEVVTSTDVIQTEAKDSVDSQHAENKEGDAADKKDDKVPLTSETVETENPPSASPIEGSALDASEGQTVVAEIEKRPFYFLPRVPRYDDENLVEKLKHAEAQVEQKTQGRDALRVDIQKIRATCKDYDISYKAAMAEERSARKAMHSKRQEIEALQSVISRVKSAASVDDINSRMQNMEHMIQHETLSLSEEKGYIREIKQLKQLREQISSSMGTKDEIKQALDEKDQTEERLKVLRKELDVLRSDLSKVEAVTKAAKKKCDEEWEAQSNLQKQFRAADAVRQEAFAQLQDLKKQQREKNKYFFKYRDYSRAASEMALKKDRAALQNLCSDQVENFMNMWNNDEEFRKYYVRCNTRSTYRRLGTLDGRSLGPDEEPPRITYAARTDRLRTSTEKAEKHETTPVSAQQEKVIKHEGPKVESNGKAITNSTAQKSQTTKSKKTVKPNQPPPIVKELVSEKEKIEKSATKEEEEEEEETPKLTKEEEELIKKEEERRKQKEAAKMKEQHRLEEIAKAKEAMERKKKREEKAKARALIKAQKEAEEREKEREKKQRKKERRKEINTSEETTENQIDTSETVVETPRETEIPKVEENQQIKKSHKSVSTQFLKQNKSKSIPLPLRNRNSKRKLRQWMWIGLIVLVVLALFLLGNANLSFSSANLWFI